jgi:anti-sigma regulatory factor (Ser/Thr protein kinase)
VADERIETQLPSMESSPASARAFLRAALQTWKLDGFGEITELLTDELVSNVVRHVDAPMTVRAICWPQRIRVEVEDPSPEPPRLIHPDDDTARGRGILLVDALSTDWGADVSDTGKTVWFEIDVTTATQEVHEDTYPVAHPGRLPTRPAGRTLDVGPLHGIGRDVPTQRGE